MFLLGLSLAVFLVVASIALGGWDKLVVFWDTPSVAWVFLGVLFHIHRWGRPYFLPGLKAIFRTPKTGDPAIANYFRRLTVWTVGVGIAGMLYGGGLAVSLLSNPYVIGYALAVMLLTFFYAACLAMMIFAPISVRFSIGEAETETERNRRFPVPLTLLGLAAFFLTRSAMALTLATIMTDFDNPTVLPQAEDVDLFLEQAVWKFNPGDPYGDLYNYLHPQMYWDTPSLLLIAGWLWAFRLSAGKPKNRLNWIPIAILYGILGSVIGMVLMLCDLDPDKLGSGCMVALLTAFYGLIAAVFFAIGSWRLFWIFILTFPVAMFTWALPHVFLVSFSGPEKAMSVQDKALNNTGFLLIYGACLYFYFRNIVGSFWASKLSGRKPKSRFDWIPIAIIYGILLSIIGVILMLSDLDPDKYYSLGCMVALLTAFYGLIAAAGGWRLVFWIFILTFPVAMFTWVLPHVFLVPFSGPEKAMSVQSKALYYTSFLLIYGTLLYFYYRNIIGVVRTLEQWFRKPPENAEPMSSAEEQAQQILDSAVRQQKPE